MKGIDVISWVLLILVIGNNLAQCRRSCHRVLLAMMNHSHRELTLPHRVKEKRNLCFHAVTSVVCSSNSPTFTGDISCISALPYCRPRGDLGTPPKRSLVDQGPHECVSRSVRFPKISKDRRSCGS